MRRQELGSGVWYDNGLKGYVMLDVTNHIPSLVPVQLDGVGLLPKDSEFHVSIAKVRSLSEMHLVSEQSIVDCIKRALPEQDQFGWGGFSGDFYRCHKPNQQGELQTTVIAGVDIIGLAALERAVREDLGLPVSMSRPHVTLLKSANSPYGIGINSPEELATLCTRDDDLGCKIFDCT